MRALAVSIVCGLAIACGAASPSAPSTGADHVCALVPTETVPIVGPPAGVDVLASAFTIDIAQSESGGAHHCIFVLADGALGTWSCYGRRPLELMQGLSTDRGTTIRDLVTAVDDWGAPLDEGEPDAPITLTLWSAADAVVRTGVRPENEPAALRALREALMSVAQDELALVRAASEECAGCPAGSYCWEDGSCSNMGSDMKDCTVVRACSPRRPAASECSHDYECESLRCGGRDELFGRCD